MSPAPADSRSRSPSSAHPHTAHPKTLRQQSTPQPHTSAHTIHPLADAASTPAASSPHPQSSNLLTRYAVHTPLILVPTKSPSQKEPRPDTNPHQPEATNCPATRRLLRLRGASHQLAHRDPRRPHHLHHDGLHHLCQSSHPLRNRHAARRHHRRHLSLRGLRQHPHGSTRQLPARPRPRHGSQRLLHLHRRQSHARPLADRARRRLPLRHHLPGPHVHRNPPAPGRRDPPPTPRR